MFYNIINSERQARDSATVTSPRTNEVLWEVTVANETDLNDAVEAARVSFKSWKLLSVEERQGYLLKLADELERRRDEIHVPLAAETGKSKLLANIEIDDTLAFIRFNASQSFPDKVEYENDKLKIVSIHHPIGVVGAICPWNFPLVLAAGKIAAALVMGNCIIVKPSPFTPCATLKFAELASSVLPRGVFQALNGDNDIGRLITIHPGIDKISFTGSTETGKKVAESAAKTLKRVTLELGGNDASVVCPDVDVKTVAAKVAAGSFFHSGQMCVATKRVYVHEAIFQEFRDAFVEAVKNITIDLSGDHSPLFSPIQNELQYKLVKDLIADCKENNYTLLRGGNSDDKYPGLFIAPVVVDQPPPDSLVVQIEQFGPIIPLMKWSTEDEVISRVNGTDTGLGACVWANDIGTAKRITRKLQVGTVWINSAEVPSPHGYLSGWKQSGIGGEWGNQGLLSYSQTQTVQLYK
ncbi:Aldehyde dehydrogenase N-terminal [Penicillium vulpinum]|uniref:aldehyde dehydrogenase (NAD(+)) n=1 Tax=Penicillium vulpinum TaxID=29845 RepID=A0A1V6SE97_9EURO|nr:Aldehyde dehydrogenase N-terminal [Penicillium vulpinum]KAJ5958651.1 Aldehyde dehydrogenase N-terminal [Penicillium vulpinum]OQE12089.1 hypothetical protein PENVUL_c001G00189 [Penicillium vulpinum]